MTPRGSSTIAGFDLNLDERSQEHHFLVIVPEEQALPVSISEHTRWSESEALRNDRSRSLADRLALRRSLSLSRFATGVAGFRKSAGGSIPESPRTRLR